MAAVAHVNDLLARQGGVDPADVTDDDLDSLRNVCRYGTYHRIREAIRDHAQSL